MMQLNVRIFFDEDPRRLTSPLEILHRLVRMHAGSAQRDETRLRKPRNPERRAQVNERAIR